MVKERNISKLIQSQGPLITLLALCLGASIFFPDFPTTTNLANILRQVSMTGLVAIGMTLVIISGGIDLSVGATAAVASVLAAQWSGESVILAILLPILAGTCIGAINGLLITRARIPAFIATLAVMLGARGLAFHMSDGTPVGVETATVLSQISKTDILGLPLPGIIFLLVLAIAIVIAGYTRFGRSLYAIGGNEEAAVMMGLGVKRNKMLAYMICGAMAGAAGMLLTSRIDSGQPTAAAGWELMAIAAVVIGGTSLTGGQGKMSHTLYGVLLILGVIPKIINLIGTIPKITDLIGTFQPWYNDLITGVLLLAVVLIQERISRQSLQ